MRDLLILADEHRSGDMAALNELQAVLRSAGSVKTVFQSVPSANSADANGLLINRIDPAGSMQLFIFGNVALPAVTMFSPDGHGETVTLASIEPWTVGSRGTTRPVGVVNLEGVGASYSDYLARLVDYVAGRTTFERMGVADDHLAYRTDISPHGDTMQKQIEAAFGVGTCLRFDNMDGDIDGYTSASGPAPYFSELGSHRPAAYGLFSGGRDKTALYYLGTAQAALQLKPAALLILIFGSGLMDFSGMALLPALLAGGLASVWTGYYFPDLSKWLAGQETLGDAILKHIVLYGWEGAINLMGFPGLMAPPQVQPKPRTPVSIPVVTPTPTPVPVTTGASKLSSDEFNALDVRLKAVEAFMKAQQTGQTTSQGQTGAPTGTVPATGNSDAPPTGTGAAVVPALVINCGAADSLSAKSGLVWLNLPEASVAIDLTSVAVPLPIGVYHSGRGGARAEWAFAGYPAGTLAVRLDFNEPHWALPGNRLQDVTINGVKVLSGFDIVSVAGAMNKAISKNFTALIGVDGVLSIVLTATPGSPDMNTYLCGIGIG